MARCCAFLLRLHLSSISDICDTLQSCLMEVREKLEQAVEQLHLPPWPAAAVQAHPPASAILARRFGKGIRLLVAVAAFEGVLAREQLIAIAMDKLVNRQVGFC